MKPPKSSLPSPKNHAFISWGVVVLFGLWFIGSLFPSSPKSSFDFSSFGQLPVLHGGRIKPLDTVARSSLLMMSGKQTVRAEDGRLSATQWVTNVLFNPQRADTLPVFEIDDPDVLGLMGLEQTNKRRYSFADVSPYLQEIESQAVRANDIESGQRTRFEAAILNLANRLLLYQKLENTLNAVGVAQMSQHLQTLPANLRSLVVEHQASPKAAENMKKLEQALGPYQFMAETAEFLPLPDLEEPANKNKWDSLGHGIVRQFVVGTSHPLVSSYVQMRDAFQANEVPAFNQALNSTREWFQSRVPGVLSRAHYEVLFNVSEPFYKAMVIYALVFILAFLSWIAWPLLLNRTAYRLLILAFAIHTLGLFSRMILQGRPPVTNLYSSAIFVGWVAVLLGIVMERLFRQGFGSAVASVIGFITLIVAHHLATQGDTLEMMRAVLDSNFWLATHVVTITIGYSSTFLSGFLAILYLARRAWDPGWNDDSANTLERMVYGIVCFSTFFSFLGTILGGIWADQSWGRFWGWDPKENGALMIVLWNAFLLHARWGRLAEPKSFMMMAVFGNIITAFSWFGVNMLGIGLHSYGFMDKAFLWLMFFVITQVMIMGLGLLPERKARAKG